VRLGPSTPGDYVRARVLVPRNPGVIEAQVEQLRTELRHRNRVWVEDGQRINELRADVRHLQDELAEQDW
jgi:hypothetical protein